MPDHPAPAIRPRSTASLRFGLVLLAVVGCVTCAVLVRLSLPSATPATLFGAAVCPPSRAVNCDYVLGSRWARIGPIPVAVLGLAYFLTIAGWFVLVGVPNRRGRRWHLLPLVLVSVGACGSVGFMYLMAFRLPVWCTWCVAAHIVNALVFVLVLLSWPWKGAAEGRGPAPCSDRSGVPPAEAEPPYPSTARACAVGGAVVAIGLLVVLAGFAQRVQWLAWHYQTRYLAATNDVDYIEWRYRQAPVHDISIRLDDLALGPADAPFTIVAFTDFSCPKCRAFFLSAGSLVERFPEKLRCVFRQYPLSSGCNPHVPSVLHVFSCEAAEAAEALRTVGTLQQTLDYHRALYGNMSRFDERPYPALAGRVGVDPARFSSAWRDGAGRDRLRDDIALAHDLGVEATPALFLNGRRLIAWRIITFDRRHELDQDQTLALWERLLGVAAKRRETKPAE